MTSSNTSFATSLALRLLSLSITAFPVAIAIAQPAAAQTFTNPLGSGADPRILQVAGTYYLVQSDGIRNISVYYSDKLATLETKNPAVTVYSNSAESKNWAPEIHCINGKFYIYASVDNGIRVLEATSATGPYTDKGLMGGGGWIDPSILQLADGSLYLLYSNYPSVSIVAMSNPWTTTGSSTQLTSPTYGWEGSVNENPAAIVNGGKLYVTYSANAWGTADYATGLLTAPLTSNLLSASSYGKSATPVFAASSANGVYGPGGMNSFKSPDGTEDWISYHAYNTSNGNAGGNRTVRAQKFTFNSDGSPNFGLPASTSTTLASPSGEGGSAPVLTNGGFETDGVSTSMIAGWTTTPGAGTGNSAAFTETYGQNHGGNWHLAQWSGSPYEINVGQTLNVPNGPYTVTAWLESTGGQQAATMSVSDYDAAGSKTSITPLADASAYRQGSITANVTTGKLTVGFYSKDTQGGHWMRVDDVAVIPAAVANYGFEKDGVSTSNISGWTVTPASGTSAFAAFTETYGQSHSGNWHLANWSGSPYEITVSQDVAIANGDRTVSVWMESTGGQQAASMILSGYDSAGSTKTVTPSANTSAYTSYQLTVPVTTGKVNVAFYSKSSGNQWLRVDDVIVQ